MRFILVLFVIIVFDSFSQIIVFHTPNIESSDTWLIMKQVELLKDTHTVFLIDGIQTTFLSEQNPPANVDSFLGRILEFNLESFEVHGVSIGSSILELSKSSETYSRIDSFCLRQYSESFEMIIHKGDLCEYSDLQDSIIYHLPFDNYQKIMLLYSLGRIDYIEYINTLNQISGSKGQIILVTSKITICSLPDLTDIIIVPETLRSKIFQPIKHKFPKKFHGVDFQLIESANLPRKIFFDKNYYFETKYLPSCDFIYVTNFSY